MQAGLSDLPAINSKYHAHHVLFVYTRLFILQKRADQTYRTHSYARTEVKSCRRAPAIPDTTEYPSNPYALVDGNPVFGTNFYSPSAFIQVRNKASANLMWTFTPTIAPTDGFVNQQIFAKGSKVMLSKWHEAYCLDGQTGIPNWATNFRPQKAELYATVIGEQFYKFIYWAVTENLCSYAATYPLFIRSVGYPVYY